VLVLRGVQAICFACAALDERVEAFQYALDLDGLPFAVAARSGNALGIQPVRNGPQARRAGVLRFDCRADVPAALASARACRAARDKARIFAVGFTPRFPPSFLPRFFAAARAALVLAEIMPASSSATATICCNMKRPVAPSI